MQIKDARAADGREVPAGEGDGELLETLAALRADGFDGFLSLEPHLAESGRFSGHSSPRLYRVAVQALKQLLDEQGIPWA